jgi:methylmalonyl-CoA/ethylmalonyl-CoA epimerase
MKLHHVGVACLDINQKLKELRLTKLVISETPVVYDSKQSAELCMLEMVGGYNLELISGKPVESIVKKNITYYHLCYLVEDIDDSIKSLIKNGFILVSPPKEAILFDRRLVAFLYGPFGLIEILNEK